MDTLDETELHAVCDALNGYMASDNEDWKEVLINNVADAINLGMLHEHGITRNDLTIVHKLSGLEDVEFENLLKNVADYWGIPHEDLNPSLRVEEQDKVIFFDWGIAKFSKRSRG